VLLVPDPPPPHQESAFLTTLRITLVFSLRFGEVISDSFVTKLKEVSPIFRLFFFPIFLIFIRRRVKVFFCVFRTIPFLFPLFFLDLGTFSQLSLFHPFGPPSFFSENRSGCVWYVIVWVALFPSLRPLSPLYQPSLLTKPYQPFFCTPLW